MIYEGRIVGEFPPDATEEELGIAMTGGGRRAAGGAVSLPDALERARTEAGRADPGAARLAGLRAAAAASSCRC